MNELANKAFEYALMEAHNGDSVRIPKQLTMQDAIDIANNDSGDYEAQHCVKVLKSIQATTVDAIGCAIE